MFFEAFLHTYLNHYQIVMTNVIHYKNPKDAYIRRLRVNCIYLIKYYYSYVRNLWSIKFHTSSTSTAVAK